MVGVRGVVEYVCQVKLEFEVELEKIKGAKLKVVFAKAVRMDSLDSLYVVVLNRRCPV